MILRNHIFNIIFMVFCLSLSSFADTQVSANDFILDVDKVHALQNFGKTEFLFVDVRSSEAYSKGHIEGAINLQAKHSFNEVGDGTRIASLDQVRKYFSEVGIRNSDSIIIYDDGNLKNASHVFWLMQTYGHKNARVLNGGFPDWVKNKGKVSEQSTRRSVSQYTPAISANHLSSMLTTRLAMKNPNATIVDARIKSHYLGDKSAAKRFGHITDAISIPSGHNFVMDGNIKKLKKITELKQLYKDIEPDNNVITYCNKGKESAISYLVMRNLGFNVSVYDGAWLEWGNENNTPITNLKKQNALGKWKLNNEN